jgi:outer membrane lipopolysaccharide assembly protein LptE/RlpB
MKKNFKIHYLISTMIDFKRYKQLLLPVLATIMLLSTGGCGYQMGSIMHPQVKSIAIAPVTNDTLEPFAAAEMRGALCEKFQFDNSLKLKQLDTADCILYGKIVEVKTTATMEDSFDYHQTYRAAEWSVSVIFEFVVLIPGRKKPLISKRRVSGSAKYQVAADQAITRKRGVRQACRNAAEQAVVYTTEAW